MSSWFLRRISHAIRQGAVIAYPTDTIWGFGCHPMNYRSIQRLLDIKQRPVHKGLILLASSLKHCKTYIHPALTKTQYQQLEKKQNHPVTWLVPAAPDCPNWLTGDSLDIAIRISDHPFIRLIGQQLQSPIVSTSANHAGQATPRSALLIRKQFYHDVDFIIGRYKTGKEHASEIKSLRSGKIIRAYQST